MEWAIIGACAVVVCLLLRSHAESERQAWLAASDDERREIEDREAEDQIW